MKLISTINNIARLNPFLAFCKDSFDAEFFSPCITKQSVPSEHAFFKETLNCNCGGGGGDAGTNSGVPDF